MRILTKRCAAADAPPASWDGWPTVGSRPAGVGSHPQGSSHWTNGRRIKLFGDAGRKQ